MVERNGTTVARLVPAAEGSPGTLGEAFAAWRAAAPPSSEFADALDEVDSLEWPPDEPWDS